MREFTKSMMSYTWAMSLFGVQQMVNVIRPSKAAKSFDNVTGATEEEFGDALKAAFRAGDNLQKGMVDLTFGVLTFGMFDRGGGGSRVASDIGQQSAEALRQGMRAVGQTADAVGQAVQGTANATADAARQGAAGWASQSQRSTGRGDGPTYDRGAEANARREQSSGASGGQGTGWGPMPSQSSGPSGR